MPDVAAKLSAIIDPLVEPGETLEAMCFGSRVKALRSWLERHGKA